MFISYKTEDFLTAQTVKKAIEAHDDFKAYLDRIDDSLLKDDPELAEHLLRRIDECDQLLAVVSRVTVASWWVPWEIGVGSEKHYFLATFLRDKVPLPSYLGRWPVLRSTVDVPKYCDLSRRMSKQRDLVVARESTTLGREAVSAHTATVFHARLRSALGQD